ncbi:hypothetical protein P9239_21715 [Caballeronia sp. LZ062]|uniref:hypothetical protein n=1 Tax=unclassified Caballeronia TaxID=2646786 RepID=UPI0028603EDE|nr:MULTISPECIES: hypothetical protein [unclassified Caballeronia]MDR5856299.1 hypothetical protein [Caballeronia sp. LZ050]MDR5872969.1 hypothetical protein [Caballeronia sp. LZ062]
MPTKLEFETPEGRLSLPIDDVEFMAYDAGEATLHSMRHFIERMRAMGLGQLAEAHARLLAQNKLHVIELREARHDAEALLACGAIGEAIEDHITPRIDMLRDGIAQTHAQLRASVERLAALSEACHQALHQIPGYRAPSRPRD